MLRVFLAFVCAATALVGCQKSDSSNAPSGSPVAADKLPVSAPQGWREEKHNGKAVLIGPVVDGFRTNVNMIIEPFAGNLDAYADMSIKSLQRQLGSVTVLDKSAFKTDSGIVGVRFVCSTTIQGNKLRQTFYCFDAGERNKHIFTCSAPASRGDQLAPKFDEIMRTYKP